MAPVWQHIWLGGEDLFHLFPFGYSSMKAKRTRHPPYTPLWCKNQENLTISPRPSFPPLKFFLEVRSNISQNITKSLGTSTYMTSLVKFTEPESRMVAARGGELALSRTEFPFGMMKKFWRRMVVRVAKQCECTQCHWAMHLKWLRWSILCYVYVPTIEGGGILEHDLLIDALRPGRHFQLLSLHSCPGQLLETLCN